VGVAVVAIALVALVALEVHHSRAGDRMSLALNHRLHELRRPLQALVLLAERPHPERPALRACLEQARAAARELDATINGGAGTSLAVSMPLGEVTSSIDRRWRPFGVEVHAPLSEVAVVADPVRLGAAVDNLVANALDHGTGRVDVRASAGGGEARIEVHDDGPSPGSTALPHDPRRGHGLTIAREAAHDFGGLLLGPEPSADGGTLAAVTLPLGGPERG
jgi:signal transduction histidine kinase